MNIEVIVKDDDGNVVENAIVIAAALIKKDNNVKTANVFKNINAWDLKALAKTIELNANDIIRENVENE